MRGLRFALLGAVLFAVLSAVPASASCLAPPEGMSEEDLFKQQVAAARVVFIGTVASLSNGDRTAAVKVEAVWKGPGLPAEVVVRGGPEGQNAATSVDRAFEQGKRYIFFPEGEGPSFHDNICSPTREFTPELAAYRPTATQDESDTNTSSGISPWLIAGGIAVILAALGGVAVAYKRSH